MILAKDEFFEVFSHNGIALTDSNYEKFSLYSDMLCEWNKKCNLTAITDARGISIKHFLDSVLPFENIDFDKNASIIDVGTGAGFPSIPLKILNNDLKITLLDSLNKRVVFLEEVTKLLGLGADIFHGRAEEFGKKAEFREQYDIATARAVAKLSVLCEYCLPFIKVGGIFVALKGSNGLEEVNDAENAIEVLGGKLLKAQSYNLENGDGRTLIVIKKISQTLTKYPRNKGVMTKKPL